MYVILQEVFLSSREERVVGSASHALYERREHPSPSLLAIVVIANVHGINFCIVNYRYEWVSVGMLDYNSDTKLFLVKRVHIPNHVMEANAKRKDKQLAQKSQIDRSGSNTNVVDESTESKSSV